MTAVILSVPRYKWLSLSHPSSCLLVNHAFMDPHSRAPAQRRIQAMEMRCYHKILRISYKDHVTKEEVRAKIQQAIEPHEDLLTIIKRYKQQWYGHVSCSSALAKSILQGTVKRGRRRGRQKTRWEDNIRIWTGLDFAKSHRAVENREKWRKLVAKSSLVPQRPSRLSNTVASSTHLDRVSCSGPSPGSVAHQCCATPSQTSSDSLAPALRCLLEAWHACSYYN